jgi:hypothetical protein
MPPARCSAITGGLRLSFGQAPDLPADTPVDADMSTNSFSARNKVRPASERRKLFLYTFEPTSKFVTNWCQTKSFESSSAVWGGQGSSVVGSFQGSKMREGMKCAERSAKYDLQAIVQNLRSVSRDIQLLGGRDLLDETEVFQMGILQNCFWRWMDILMDQGHMTMHRAVESIIASDIYSEQEEEEFVLLDVVLPFPLPSKTDVRQNAFAL